MRGMQRVQNLERRGYKQLCGFRYAPGVLSDYSVIIIRSGACKF